MSDNYHTINSTNRYEVHFRFNIHGIYNICKRTKIKLKEKVTFYTHVDHSLQNTKGGIGTISKEHTQV